MIDRADAPRTDGTLSSRRLFFALWPTPERAAELAGAVRRLVPPAGGRPQRADQLHVTLEFLGSVPDARLPLVLEAGELTAAAARRCDVVLDAVEHWRRPQVLCLTVTDLPPELVALVQGLRASLRERGFEPETREFRVHLTLARKVRRAPRVVATDPVRWPVDELALVESITSPQGSRYERLAGWPLGA